MQNIFVVEKPASELRRWVKIGDFGVSKRITNNETGLRTIVGTPHFQAPEITGYVEEESSGYSNAVDMWSLGCVIYILLARQVPFPNFPSLKKFAKEI